LICKSLNRHTSRRRWATFQKLSSTGKTGCSIEPGDSKSLAAAILEFISDKKLAALCAANGLRYAIKHFSFDDIDRGKASSRCFIDRHRDGKTASCAQ